MKSMEIMDALDRIFEDYKQLLSEGKVQKAYRGIIQFMMQLQTRLKKNTPSSTCPAFIRALWI